MMHCEDNRAQEQKVFVETADGKFRYQLFMDYAKGAAGGSEAGAHPGQHLRGLRGQGGQPVLRAAGAVAL